MQKTKILHILYSGQGGLGTYFMNFVNSDQEKQFEHFAFFYGIEPLNQELEDFCIDNKIQFKYQQKQSKIDFKALKTVMAFQQQHQIQYLLLHTFSLSLLTLFGLFMRWRLIAFDHTTLAYKTLIEKVFTLINHLFAYKMIYFYTGHFEQNKSVFPLLSFGKNSHIIPKTVDINFFQPPEEKPKNDVFTIGITARLIQGKRHDLIVETLAKLRDQDLKVNFKIAGIGPKEKEIKELVSKLHLDEQVEFTGLLTRNELLSFYHSLDAYIHASEGETICYSIMEAQACGLPILASDVEGINNVIFETTGGFLFKNNNADLVSKFNALLSSDEKLNYYKEQSREAAVNNFTNFNNAALLYSKLN
ncbi:glycosyltransferase family 4 protein [Marivirga salinae]|uniref:Glycosyltransferase family 4 protein n=1 Tax=Marivirga salinarum TaxID=3059078 RepID=A0AA49GAQ1_9BACT|nr:glycosyltransferase family 4 protein [Marivirga sp. BDSF4-3]WKK74515.2 glycosyltransferase family 4 protein [Marivirga sp. BDSF4-3]